MFDVLNLSDINREKLSKTIERQKSPEIFEIQKQIKAEVKKAESLTNTLEDLHVEVQSLIFPV